MKDDDWRRTKKAFSSFFYSISPSLPRFIFISLLLLLVVSLSIISLSGNTPTEQDELLSFQQKQLQTLQQFEEKADEYENILNEKQKALNETVQKLSKLFSSVKDVLEQSNSTLAILTKERDVVQNDLSRLDQLEKKRDEALNAFQPKGLEKPQPPPALPVPPAQPAHPAPPLNPYGEDPVVNDADAAHTEDVVDDLNDNVGNDNDETDPDDEDNNYPDAPQPPPAPLQPPLPQQPQHIQHPEKELSEETVEGKRQAVKKEFMGAWKAYKDKAWGCDELKPVSGGCQNWLQLGGTIVDALDTLIIMEASDEVQLAKEWIASNLHFDLNKEVSFFETSIRIVGGLLSAYDLSGEKVFLDKAEDLGQRLLKAFGDNALPLTSINLVSGRGQNAAWTGNSYILSEIGTVQLEYLALALRTGKPELAVKALNVFKILDEMPKEDNIYRVFLKPGQGWTSQRSTLGALGDSFYEYLLKMALFTRQDGYRRMYNEAADGILKHMISYSSPSNLLYINELDHGFDKVPKMDHLACFAAGMFGLGARDGEKFHEKHFEVARGLAYTCHLTYDRTTTKIGPEIVVFGSNDFAPSAKHYLLRPEAIEGFFYMWRLTHEEKYRQWGWEAFDAIRRHCRLPSGAYSGIRDVTASSPSYDDLQQTFLFAETFKYLYLLFSEDNVISFDEYVFNTEAHPLRKADPNIDWPSVLRETFPHA